LCREFGTLTAENAHTGEVIGREVRLLFLLLCSNGAARLRELSAKGIFSGFGTQGRGPNVWS
jgi:hypothetical protein